MSDTHKNVGLRITSDPDKTSVTQPGTGAAKREDPMPLRLLLAADLVPQRRPSRTESQVRRADPNTFAGLMEDWEPALRLDVPNQLGPQPKSLEIGLRFRSLKDFEPAGVARQIPALARLLAIRTEVEGVRSRGTDRETFRERLGEAGVDAASADGLYAQLTVEPPKPKPAPKPKDDDPLDRLMGMVDTGDGEPPDAESSDAGPRTAGDALADAVSDGAPRVARSAADAILADFDRKLGGQLRAIIEHPDFRRLEAAWRGLKLLVDRLPLRDGVQLDVVAARREALSETLYYQVLMPEHERTGDPLAAIVLGFAFDQSADDVALLGDLAETGASLQAPVIASAAPSFLGLDAPDASESLPFVPQLVGGPEYIAWNKLRDTDEARHVALAFPPFLLRAPYGSDNPSKEVSVEEQGHVWGGGALAVALAIADSYAETGWPTRLAGRRIEGLPLHVTERGATPLAMLMPEAKAAELSDVGLIPLVGTVNRDRLELASAPNLSRPAVFDDREKTAHAAAHATLACGLFTARAAHRMLTLPDEIDPAASLEAKREAVVDRLRRFLGEEGTEGAVSAEAVPDAEIEGHDLLAVRLQPPRRILDTPVHLAVGLPVPRAE